MAAIAKEVREEILARVKKGEKVAQLSKQYGVSEQTIYSWLKGSTTKQVSLIQHNKVMKENRELKAIVGALMIEVERLKKKRASRRTD